MNPDEELIGQVTGILFVALCATGFYLLLVQISLAIPVLEPLIRATP